MELVGKLLIVAIFGSCAIIAVGIVLSLMPGHRVRGEQFMRAGATGAIAIIVGLTAWNVVVRPGVPAWENVVKFLAISLAVWYWKRTLDRRKRE